MQLSHWNKDDITMHRKLEELISKHASWNVSTADSINLYRCIVWLAGIGKKIEDSQVEILAVHNKEPERIPGKKATREAKAAEANS